MGAIAMADQELCDRFYDIDNIVTISVEMPESAWTTLSRAEPHGGRCAHEFTGDRYDWFNVPKVTISGSSFPGGGPHSFSSVGLKKRSYCGSFSTSKPSLALNFGHFNAANTVAMESLIGTRYITLNNSKQDDSFIRQALGYELFKRAGLPYSRCNFAQLRVNGNEIGFYVNVEPIKESYIRHNFQNNDAGNLYELEVGEDLTEDLVAGDRLSFEGFSSFADRADLRLAAQTLASEGTVGMNRVIDTAQFLRFYSMEILLKHWDGYSHHRNNAYVYNDVEAVANPTYQDVRFKFIPWGLDQTLQGDHEFRLYGESILAELVLDDSNLLRRLRLQIGNYAHGVFGDASYHKVLHPLISKMESILVAAGQDDVSDEIESVRQQLLLVPRRVRGLDRQIRRQS